MFITFRFFNADVGPEHPAEMSPIARHVTYQFDVIAPYQEGSDNKEDITRNLEGLACGIPDYPRVGDIPR